MRRALPGTASWLVPLLLVTGLTACGPKNLKERTRHGESLTQKAASVLDEAEQELVQLEAESAREHLEEARELLSHPNVELSPESEEQRIRLKELQARIDPARTQRSQKELDTAVGKQRDSVTQTLGKLPPALEALERKDAGLPQVEAVLATVEQIRERLNEGKKLEPRSEAYAAFVRSTEQSLEQASVKARSTQQLLEFIAGPVAARHEAEALEKQAQEEKDPDTQLTLYTSAIERFQRCGETAKQLLTQAPQLERSPLQVEGQASTPKSVASGCASKASSLQKTLAKLEKAKAARDKKRTTASKPKSKSKKRSR